MPSTEERLTAALTWAAHGSPVLPVRPGEKAPLTAHGLDDASTDPSVVRGWWSRWPEANVAIATGAPGVDVLDVDVRGSESGWAAMRRLHDAGLLEPGAPFVRTPSGGVHVYFAGTKQRNGSLHGEHLDFRSSGGYVLVPPSTVATDTYDGSYKWERTGAPTTQLDWQTVIDLLRPVSVSPPDGVSPARIRSGSRWDVHTLAAVVERTPPSNRNNRLFWAFCEGLRSGYDLRPIADAGVRCGQTPREVQATWRQAVKRVTSDGQLRPSPAMVTRRSEVTAPIPAPQI